jgi:hypothetical protein
MERFWSKVDKVTHPNGCWVWLAGENGVGDSSPAFPKEEDEEF